MWDAYAAKVKREKRRFTEKDERALENMKERYCCFSYLREWYDTISYTSGTVLYEAANYPVSPLLNSILEINDFHRELNDDDVDNPNDYFTEEVFYEYREQKRCDYEILTIQDIRSNERYSRIRLVDGKPYFDPEEDSYRIREAGRSYIIVIGKLNTKDDPDIIESLTAPRSPYYMEYKKLRDYYEHLKQQEKTTEGNVFRRSSLSRAV